MKYLSQVLTVSALLCLAAVSHAEMTVNVGGRIQADAAFYNEDITELGSGTEFRRARFFVSGDVDETWDYKLEIDFADGSLSMTDAYLSRGVGENGKIKVGHFRPSFSLEEMTSSKYITLMERSLPTALGVGRRLGVGYDYYSNGLYWSSAIFGNSATDTSSDEGVGVASRVAKATTFDSGALLHLGAALAIEEPRTTDDGASGVRFRARPESHVTSTRLVDTGTIADVSLITKMGLEAAYVAGPWSFQSEYMMASADAEPVDVDVDGYYVTASWFPGGETRAYKNGSFGRTKATNAWEFALRYSSLNLDDGVTMGGEESNISLGANYYVNPYLRYMINYVLVDSEVAGISDDPDVLQFRISMDFK